MGALRGNARRVFLATLAVCAVVAACSAVTLGVHTVRAVPNAVRGAVVRTDGRIATGDKHTCMIRDDGSVWCWGNNDSVQLGQAALSDPDATTPVQVDAFTGGARAVQLVAGRSHVCALLSNGGVDCWGDDGYGQLGDNGFISQPSPTSVNLGAGKTAVSLSAGGYETCALLNDASTKCWGKNTNGQVGNNATATAVSTPTLVSNIPSSLTVRALEPGTSHACAVADTGAVWCWGRNNVGQLGNTAGADVKVPTATQSLGTGVTAVQVSSGDLHTCVVTAAGKVLCWGSNVSYQLGNTNASSATPTLVSLSTDALKVGSGSSHSCALLADGSVWCWGANANGELGQGSTGSNTSTPAQVTLASRAVDISVGSSHTCALLDTGLAQCWGLNDRGQLGVGDKVNKPSATAVSFSASSPATPVASSSSVGDSTANIGATIGINDGGATYRVEYGTTPGLTGTNTVISTGAWGQVAQVATGEFASCILTTGGAVRCWGSNANGELGNGTNASSAAPVQAGTLTSGVRRIAVGLHHGCAVLTNGSVQCWGLNTGGQLGNGSNGTSTTPVNVNLTAGEKAVDVAAGDDATCVVLGSGAVRCWGGGSAGQLGNGGNNPSTSPVAVSLTANDAATRIAMRGQHACVTLGNGTVKCWGDSAIGDGTHTTSNVPVAAALGANTARSVAVGTQHACASLADGSVQCWGTNGHGQLGDGGTTPHSTPVNALSFGAGDFADKVVAAGDATCVQYVSGNTSCWGAGSGGVLGQGATDVADHTSAVAVTLANSDTAATMDISTTGGCALGVSGLVQCWGSNANGQRGVGASAITGPLTLESFSSRSVNVPLSGLASGTTYYARVVARWQGADTSSTIISFATSTPTTTTASTSSSVATTTSTVVNTTAATTPVTTSPATTQASTTSLESTTTSVAIASATTTIYVRPLVIDIRIKLHKTASAPVIANAVSMAIPKKSRGSMRISITSGRNICAFAGTSVRGVRKGTCKVTVVLIPLHGTPMSRTTRIIVR